MPTAAVIDRKALAANIYYQPKKMSASQHADLADGVVTYDEYVAAFHRMVSCVEAGGYQLQMREETNEVLGANIPDAAGASYEKCYTYEFGIVDEEWQIYRENFGAEAKALAACMTNHGAKPRLTYLANWQQLSSMGINPQSGCIDKKIHG